MKPRLELIIIDDFIPTWMQDRLEKLTQNHSIKYEFLSFTSHIDNNNLNSEGDQFSNLILKDGQLKEYGADHFFLLPFLTACLKEGVIFDYSQFLRAKVNILFKQESKSNTYINTPHIDIDPKIHPYNLIGLYYINDSDGDTIIYEGRDKNNLKIANKISPKKGRIILFDGSQYHSSSYPLKTDKRMVINYNLRY